MYLFLCVARAGIAAALRIATLFHVVLWLVYELVSAIPFKIGVILTCCCRSHGFEC